jgi:multiple sugar transport system ATP-binding protein
MAEIRLEAIEKLFGKVRAVDGVSLTIKDREFMVLLGPSGCGKTTLLRCLAGLEYPDGGRILIGDRDVTDWPPRKRNIAMVFQSYAVFPHLTVFDNVAFGLKMRRMPRSEIATRVRRAAELLQVEGLLERHPAQLSGGQRQRVAVARAIVMDAQVLLMDEPLSNLDALLRLQMRAELKRLLQDIETTTVYVTHDQVEALSMGDRISVMKSGRIVQVDEPMTVYSYPADSFVGGFIGNPPMNFLSGRVHRENGHVAIDVEGEQISAPAPLAEMHGRPITIGVRAENVQALTDHTPGSVPANVMVVEPLGSHLLLTARIGSQDIKVITPSDFPTAPDQRLWLKLDSLRYLDAETGLALQLDGSPRS